MVVVTTIFYLDGNPFYSPEFGRGGLAANFTVDVTHLALTGATQFDITVEHRNADEATFSTLGNFAAINGIGPEPFDVTGIKEIVRFKYEFSVGSPVASDAAHFLMQAPSWRPY